MIYGLLGKSKYGFPFFLLLNLFFVFTANAQMHEIGVGVGALSYTGDITRNYDLLANRPSVNAFYRRNLNDIISIKGNGMLGILHGREDGFDSFSLKRPKGSFTEFMVEATVRAEYNFIDYKASRSRTRWSPYFFAGAGVFIINLKKDDNGRFRMFQPVLPFGMGLKILHRKVWNIGIDLATHKTFFDYLDGISDIEGTTKDYNYGNPNDNDWYHSITFTLSYTIFKVPCPYPYNPFKSSPFSN